MKIYRTIHLSFAFACFVAGISSVTGGSSLFACFRIRQGGLRACTPYWTVSGRILSAVIHKERMRLAERDAREQSFEQAS